MQFLLALFKCMIDPISPGVQKVQGFIGLRQFSMKLLAPASVVAAVRLLHRGNHQAAARLLRVFS